MRPKVLKNKLLVDGKIFILYNIFIIDCHKMVDFSKIQGCQHNVTLTPVKEVLSDPIRQKICWKSFRAKFIPTYNWFWHFMQGHQNRLYRIYFTERICLPTLLYRIFDSHYLKEILVYIYRRKNNTKSMDDLHYVNISACSECIVKIWIRLKDGIASTKWHVKNPCWSRASTQNFRISKYIEIMNC